METTLGGGAAFPYLKVRLNPKETILCESDALVSMTQGFELRSRVPGGIIGALLMKFLGKESFFKSELQNIDSVPRDLVLTQSFAGQIVAVNLQDETFYMQPGAFVAAGPGIDLRVNWAGFSSWMAGEGLFRIRTSGTGTVWCGAYGAVIERSINGVYLVDNGHLFSYPKNMKLSLQMSGGIFSSLFGGEGFVLRLEGKGTIRLQTRSINGLAGWLNSKF